MQGIQQIRQANPALARKIEAQHGFIIADDVEPLIAVNRSMLVMVRCGAGRFLTPIESLNHFMGIIERHANMVQAHTGELLNRDTDHVRDVSLPANVVVNAF